MNKCLITYFSQTGTTARASERIAAGLIASGVEVRTCNIRDGKPPDVRDYDVLGIGFPVYGYGPPLNVSDYVKALPRLEGMGSFVFVTYGTYRFNAAERIREALARKGAKEAGYFHCRGADLFLPYLKLGHLFSPDHPTAKELAEAETFGREIATRVEGGEHLKATRDRAPSLIYRAERLAYSRWFITWLYSRSLKVDMKKCNPCGLCSTRCPAKNIRENKAGYPVWGRNCLMCFTCEMECPEEAISSLRSLWAFRRFMTYNVRKASGDPSIHHVRVMHSGGRTTRIQDTAGVCSLTVSHLVAVQSGPLCPGRGPVV